jgi:hypothetical protein
MTNFLCKRTFIQKNEFCPQPSLKQKTDMGIEFESGQIYKGITDLYGAIIVFDNQERSRLFTLPCRRSKIECDIFRRPFEEFFYSEEFTSNKIREEKLTDILNDNN